MAMAELSFRMFDCDNHYYEALDAFTRYLEPTYRKRAMQWVTLNGRQRLLVGGKISKFIPNPTFDPVAAPGVMDEYFRGRNPKSADPSKLFGELEPIRPEYRNRDARLAVMDGQGMEAAIFLPTLGVGMEQALVGDLPALTAAFRAFNRWLEEDWGFAYQERIFAAPYITLSEPANAVSELQWALEHDARFVVMVGGPVMTERGSRAPADPMFDGFWQLANDSGITVLYHGGETAYTKYLGAWGESDFTEAFRASAFRGLVSADALQDTFASHLALGLFHRFPNLRTASIEVGAAWVFHLFEKLTKAFGQVPHLFPEDPRETFKRHVWVSPFYEDELASLLRLLGQDHILMGSDFPHVEGLTEPRLYIKDLENFNYTPEQCRAVMYDNGKYLSVRRPAG
jgi:predicted TIM-barrel fold metal-dependent hydrolase